MNLFEKVITILDNAVGGPEIDIGVHRTFWRGLSRNEFVVKRVRNYDIVKIGDGASSMIVKALKGEAPFGADLPVPPDEALWSRMPAGLPPVSDADIAFIQKWIDDGCPVSEAEALASNFSWEPTGAPKASSRTDDIWFIDANIGWAVNSNGQILHTEDGGVSWTTQLRTKAYLRCIAFANALQGWCGTLTQGSRMFHTEDSGKNWNEVTNLPPNAPSAICGLSVVSDKVIYAAGTNFPDRPARMLKTIDGGKNWSVWEMKSWADLLVDCYFIDENTGWVVGGKSNSGKPTRANVKPVVLYTDDGGRTWVNRAENIQGDSPLGEWGWKIQFLNDRLGFVSLESFEVGAILKTVDGGKTWSRMPVNDPQKNANLEGVGFIDESFGWVGGWGDADFDRQGSSSTTDGGRTWRDANEIGKAINRFRFFGSPVEVGYASGQTVYKYARHNRKDFGQTVAQTDRETPFCVRRTICSQGVYIPLPRRWAGKEILTTVWSRFGEEVSNFSCNATESESGPALFWNLTDIHGKQVQAGQYIVRVEVEASMESYILRLLES